MVMLIMNKKEAQKMLASVLERFGMPFDAFDGFSFLTNTGKDKVWILSTDALREVIKGVKIELFGILFARTTRLPGDTKPTTNAMQLFGKHATKNVLSLTDDQKADFTKGLDFELSEDQLNDVSNGFVVVCHNEDVYGISLVQENKLKNQIPKSRRIKRL